MSHLRGHQSGPTLPPQHYRLLKGWSEGGRVCVGSDLSSHFLSARPPRRNLVIHPRALSVNKCRRLSPQPDERLCVWRTVQDEPTGSPSPSVWGDWQQDESTNQKTGPAPHYADHMLYGGLFFNICQHNLDFNVGDLTSHKATIVILNMQNYK